MNESHRPGGTFVVDAPMSEARRAEPPPPPPPVRRPATAHLIGGIGRALASPRVWLFVLLVQLLVPLPVVLQARQAFHEHVAPVADEEFPADADFYLRVPRWLFEDLLRAEPGLSEAVANDLFALAVLSSLLGLVFSAGWMSLAVQRPHHGLAGFLGAGGRFFLPFLGTWLIGLPLLAGLHWLGHGPPAEALREWLLPAGRPELAVDQRTALWVVQGLQALAVLLLLVGETVLDLSRASMVTRWSGNFLAGTVRGIAMLLRNPLRVSVVVLGGLLLELGWLEGMSILSGQGGVWSFAVLPLSLAGRVILRGGRWCGLATMSAETVPAHPDVSLEPATSRAR